MQVKEQLDAVAHHNVWGQSAPANEFNLPSFSAYPGPYVTAVGEYLMMLPTLLESVLADGVESAEDDVNVDGEWLDKVCLRPSSSKGNVPPYQDEGSILLGTHFILRRLQQEPLICT